MIDTADLLDRIVALEAEVTSLRDKDAITQLEYIYGYYLDNRMWDEIIDLFTDEAPSIEIGQRGKYVGKDAMRAFLADSMGAGIWGLEKNQVANHLQLQPVITLAGDGTAACRARALIQMSKGDHHERLRWAEGVYENTFVKDGGVWKLKSVWWAATFYAVIPTTGDIWYDSIPVDDAMPPTEPSHPIDPQLGRIWVPFHYPHPTTGASPTSPSARPVTRR
ncbi:nuclear transport factor 2 family protein [Maritimibacter sp. DP07]|uniref:Nuclear transport factor 2 family protein n=1 Tax=Maritimibacter harenae TaxID=2606218 RepID=A0A845M5P8_9RHOB|nr:nuclear transport factor 2 family protein [Maritimibacter harenae]MZR11674.1 nuclear transport factor 2 family protein [Maritimibacter harenae]